MATIAAGWGLGLAYRFGDMRAAALMQLTLFNALFLTNAQTPLSVMTGWLHSIARINPFTNILRLAPRRLAGRSDLARHMGRAGGDRRDERPDADLRLPRTSQTLEIGVDNERFNRAHCRP